MTANRAAPLVLAAIASLTGCGPLVQIGGNDKPPVALLMLRANAAAPAPAVVATAATVLVLTPAVPGPLQTLRLPVTISETGIAYLTGATWAEQPNRQFQRVLADTIAGRGLVVLDPRQALPTQGRTLGGTLLDFGLDVRDPSAAVVRVRYDATLTGRGQATLAVRRFDAAVPVASQLPGDVATALNRGANLVAAEVAAWVAN